MAADHTANLKLRVFISSVQKELEEERMQLRILLSSDPFLLRFTVPKLFEKYPAPAAARQAGVSETFGEMSDLRPHHR